MIIFLKLYVQINFLRNMFSFVKFICIMSVKIFFTIPLLFKKYVLYIFCCLRIEVIKPLVIHGFLFNLLVCEWQFLKVHAYQQRILQCEQIFEMLVHN